jgi:hypothetical protein
MESDRGMNGVILDEVQSYVKQWHEVEVEVRPAPGPAFC